MASDDAWERGMSFDRGVDDGWTLRGAVVCSFVMVGVPATGSPRPRSWIVCGAAIPSERVMSCGMMNWQCCSSSCGMN